MMHTILKYLPYVTALCSCYRLSTDGDCGVPERQGSDLANMLSSKGITKVKRH